MGVSIGQRYRPRAHSRKKNSVGLGSNEWIQESLRHSPYSLILMILRLLVVPSQRSCHSVPLHCPQCVGQSSFTALKIVGKSLIIESRPLSINSRHSTRGSQSSIRSSLRTGNNSRAWPDYITVLVESYCTSTAGPRSYQAPRQPRSFFCLTTTC
jgi:hypothetical protein